MGRLFRLDQFATAASAEERAEYNARIRGS